MSDLSQKKIYLVKDLFSRIAGRYDLFNHLASLGHDRSWRRAAARRVKLFHRNRVLDLAAGTGDLALAVGRENPGAMVVGLDFVRPMLEKAAGKLERQAGPSIQLMAADALKLPFPDSVFDSVTIGFGIRNMPDRLSVLKEIKRVLYPGGRVIILELCFPRDQLFFRGLYALYLKILIPVIGRVIARDIKMFLYLSESINAFPRPRDFIKTMDRAGFSFTGYKELTFGVCVLFQGEKQA